MRSGKPWEGICSLLAHLISLLAFLAKQVWRGDVMDTTSKLSPRFCTVVRELQMGDFKIPKSYSFC